MKIKYLKRIVLLCFVSSLAFTSCKKNNVEVPEIPFPVIVYPSSSTAKFNMKMFVGGVEITDQGKISKFVANMPANYSTTDLLSKFPASYTFTSKDSIKFSANNNFFVSKTNDRYVITTISNSAVNPVNSVDFEQFFNFKTKAVPAVSGYTITRQYAAYGDFSSFKVSVLNYKYHKISTNSSLFAYGLQPNEFDPATVSKLGPTDTLAVQEFFINYK